MRTHPSPFSSPGHSSEPARPAARPWWFAAVTGALVAGVAATVAFALTPVNGGSVGGTAIAVDSTPGEQIDPHVSGNLAAYTDQANGSGVIRYYDFLNPAFSGVVPTGDIHDVDELSDVNGDHIAFVRQHANASRSCMVFDRVTLSTFEIGPGQGAVAGATALGPDTVAFVNRAVNDGDIVVGKISDPLAPLANLSLSWRREGSPAVSPLGEVVVWESSEGAFLDSDVMKSIRSGGIWGPAQVVSDTLGAERNPDTDGISVTYDSNRASTLDGQDIFIRPISGGAEIQVGLAGLQRNPSISGGVIAFESKAPGATTWDLFIYQIWTNTLFQLTNTPSTNEILNDITTLDNGDVRVVWAADDDFFLGEHNIYARTFSLPDGLPPNSSFQVCLLYDPVVARRRGAAYPIKLQLCDASGQNLSSPSIVVHAISVTLASTNAPGPLDDTGNANADFDFRYDATLGGYIFNLSLQGFPTGTYDLNFTAGSDPAAHSARFAVK